MKKRKWLLVVVEVLLLTVFDVKALTKQQLKEKLLEPIEVGGKEYALSNDQKKLISDYIDNHNISDVYATIISEKVDAAINIIKNQGNINFKKYPQGIKDDLKQLVLDISNSTNIHATLTKDGLIVDGILINNLVKQTGYIGNEKIIILSFVIVIIGTCLIIKEIKTNRI